MNKTNEKNNTGCCNNGKTTDSKNQTTDSKKTTARATNEKK